MEQITREISAGNFSSYSKLCRLTETSDKLPELVKKAELIGYRVIRALGQERIDLFKGGHALAYIFQSGNLWELWEELV